jgi:hypothetical protein
MCCAWNEGGEGSLWAGLYNTHTGLYMTHPRPHTVTQTLSACVTPSKDDPASETASIALLFLEWGFVSGESRDRRLCVLPKGESELGSHRLAREGAGAGFLSFM